MDYLATYNKLCYRAKEEKRKKRSGIYYEAHHIIPKCMGGEGSALDTNHTNIVLLTPKEHYIAHRLLCMIYPGNKKLQFAMWCMVNGLGKGDRHKASPRVYERLRNDWRASLAESLAKPKTQEHKEKIRAALKGRKEPEEVRNKKIGRIPWNKGIKLSEEAYQDRLAKFKATWERKNASKSANLVANPNSDTQNS